MTGLEPHPILRLPPNIRSREEFEAACAKRAELMAAELNDPYTNGWESPIWGLIDDLLCDGKQIELVGRDYLEIPPEIARSKTPSLTIVGRRELLVQGANGSGKTEYAAKKIMKIDVEITGARTWSFHETDPVSVARQQPLFWKYLPSEWKPLATGKLREGPVTNISYTVKNGFTENTYVLPNKSQHWFKNYAQEEQIIEGDQLDAVWFDELVPVALVRSVRFRLVRRKGLLIVTFTPIHGWTQAVQEYRQGARTLVEATAKLLPLKDENGKFIGYEKVKRLEVAGPGTDGNLKANVIYMHSDDNPYFDKAELYETLKGARRSMILERGYGIATRAFANQFPKFSELVHVVRPDRIPKYGTRYQIVDPVAGRNWYCLWMLVDPQPIALRDGSIRHRRWVYREWPSFGHAAKSAYIPGIGDPGPWTVPGNAADGDRGPAQFAYGWGLERYKAEFERLEGVTHREEPVLLPKPENRHRNPLKRNGHDAATDQVLGNGGEQIFERRMDSRYGATPTQNAARTTTLLDEMSDLGLEFTPASGKDIGEGVQLINNLLDFDSDVEIGAYSPALSRMNQPLLYVSEECPNLIYALREWTGQDRQHGACKDPIDTLRYGVEDDLDFIGPDIYSWEGGGTYQ